MMSKFSKLSDGFKVYIRWILFITVLMLLLFYIVDLFKINNNIKNNTGETVPNTLMQEIALQRNVLSKQLNDLRKTVGQLQCEKSKDHTNDQGGWCKAASTEKGGQHMTDNKLIPVLSNFLKNKTVSSFGDGPGAYKREIMKLGQVVSYEAYDGAPYCEETSEGRVRFLDLTIPQYGIPLYDWIISLEVAEHIPTKYEDIYLDNIFRHAKEGIILSWAVPGQGGLSHINNRPLDYVINIMEKRGFFRDTVSTKLLQDSATLQWIKANLNVYRRNHQTSKLESTFATWFL